MFARLHLVFLIVNSALKKRYQQVGDNSEVYVQCRLVEIMYVTMFIFHNQYT